MKRLSLLLLTAVLLSASLLIAPVTASAQVSVGISVHIGPPPLPVYPQPFAPGPGYIWTPGYWAWGPYGYYWVPGTWVLAPFVGALWTPGYWGWSGGVYIFHVGYWGRHVGFYGGIDYGYGYGGRGYDGGYWRGDGFYYNRTVNHVTNNITNVYNKTVINNTTIVNRTSYNGGPRGIAARATPQQQAWAREPHTAPVAAQMQQRAMASRMPSLRASQNHGQPPIAATPRAGVFNGHGVAPAAARETRFAPQTAGNPQRGNALRSAGFAPHANAAMRPDASMRPAGENRYNPASTNREQARPNAYEAQRNRAPARYQPMDNGERGMPYRPQGAPSQAYRPESRYAQPAYRPEPHYAQPAYRPAEARPAEYAHTAAPQGRAAPAAHQDRRDDKRH